MDNAEISPHLRPFTLDLEQIVQMDKMLSDAVNRITEELVALRKKGAEQLITAALSCFLKRNPTSADASRCAFRRDGVDGVILTYDGQALGIIKESLFPAPFSILDVRIDDYNSSYCKPTFLSFEPFFKLPESEYPRLIVL